jgi:ADP-ribose pyrophosphatase YjhB (NUDIX family)
MSLSFDDSIRFCPHCGGPVERRHIAGRLRPHCPICQVTFFADPKLAVAVLVVQNGMIVLQRRTIDPGLGRWTFPSGFVERGERVEDAAVREVREEVGLEIRLTQLLGLYSAAGHSVVLVVYVAEPIGGQLAAGDKVDSVGLFSASELPDLAFEHDREIIRLWLSQAGHPV